MEIAPAGALPRRPHPLFELARYYDALNLAGPFIYGGDPSVAVELFDAALIDVSRPAVDLNRAIGDSIGTFGGI